METPEYAEYEPKEPLMILPDNLDYDVQECLDAWMLESNINDHG